MIEDEAKLEIYEEVTLILSNRSGDCKWTKSYQNVLPDISVALRAFLASHIKRVSSGKCPSVCIHRLSLLMFNSKGRYVVTFFITVFSTFSLEEFFCFIVKLCHTVTSDN